MWLGLLISLFYSRSNRTKLDFINKVFLCVYAGWVNQAIVLATLAYTNSIGITQLPLARGLLMTAIVVDIIVGVLAKSGYMAVSQMWAVATSFVYIKDNVL